MPDIQMRFNKDMLTLANPIAHALEASGVDIENDLEFINLIEPDSIADIYRNLMATGAQILVTNTAGITPARLLAHNLEDRGVEMATAALTVANAVKPQHVLAEIGPCKLPLDESSKTSLKEHVDQYARAIKFFDENKLDAFFLNEFENTTDLKCAIMGVRKVTAKPLFVSVNVNEAGTLACGRGTLEEAGAIAQEYQADVFGIQNGSVPADLNGLGRRCTGACDLPIMVSIDVAQVNPKQGRMTPQNPYYCADLMTQAATALRANGVQFLRAVGAATPAYTAVIAATTTGFNVL